MIPLYIEEHLNCYMYDSSNAIVRYLQKDKGDRFVLKSENNYLFFLVAGQVKYSYGYQTNMVLKAGNFMLIPRESNCEIEAEADSQIVLLKMHHRINFCNHFPLEMLYELDKRSKGTKKPLQTITLKANEIISDWLKIVIKTTSGGLKCSYYQELKQKEILFFLRAYYTKEELIAFFTPILNSDMRFSNFIYENYQTIETIPQLAKLTSYSLSGFKKKFERVFGCPPAVWIKREKAKKIYHDINSTLRSFKDIAYEHRFSSPAHFDRFCKRQFKMSPGALRKSTKEKILQKTSACQN